MFRLRIFCRFNFISAAPRRSAELDANDAASHRMRFAATSQANNRGVHLYFCQQYVDAKAQFERALIEDGRCVEAMTNLAETLWRDFVVVTPESVVERTAMVKPLYERAVRLGDAHSCGPLADILNRAGDVAGAFKVLQQGVDAGHYGCLRHVAYLYETGSGGVAKEPAKAYSLVLRGANSGDTLSMSEVARMLAHGIGVDKDEAAANDWLLRAALLEFPTIGGGYRYLVVSRNIRAGIGADKNEAAADALLWKALHKRCGEAMLEWAELNHARGVRDAAHYWHKRALRVSLPHEKRIGALRWLSRESSTPEHAARLAERADYEEDWERHSRQYDFEGREWKAPEICHLLG